jgi:hypothetical protein
VGWGQDEVCALPKSPTQIPYPNPLPKSPTQIPYPNPLPQPGLSKSKCFSHLDAPPYSGSEQHIPRLAPGKPLCVICEAMPLTVRGIAVL